MVNFVANIDLSKFTTLMNNKAKSRIIPKGSFSTSVCSMSMNFISYLCMEVLRKLLFY